MTATQLNKRVDHFRLGLLFAIASALSFGMSGPLAKATMNAGWSPTGRSPHAWPSAHCNGHLRHGRQARLGPRGHRTPQDRHRLRHLPDRRRPVATTTPSRTCPSASPCFWSTPRRFSWWVTLGHPRRRPTNLTLAGVALAVAGIMLVLTFSPVRTSTGRRGMGTCRSRARRATS